MSEGTIASYECERGFELLGPARRLCGANGKWTPDGIPFCVLNVAAGKAPMQASTEDGGVPQRALDGSTSATFSAETCTLTKPERVPWWYVNLLEPYMVQLVRLDFGKQCCGTNKAVIVVRVGNNRPDLGTNPICNRFTGFIEQGQPLFLPCNPPMPGAFVSVHLEASTPSQLSICEAFVYTDQALPIERCPQFRDQPPGSTATYNGKCYIFYDRQPASFRDALGFCRSRGGTLVVESNPALQGFISWELWRRHRSDSSSQYWMGAVRDPQDPANWKWVNGNDVTVSFWNAPGGGEGCARFDGSKGWLWADTDCQARLNYICQHQPKACGRPEQPPNSTMTADSFEVGASVEYSCDDGHLLVGPTVRTCLDTGFYDEFPPVCKRIECGFPAEIPHGSYDLMNASVSYLSHVQYSCKAGYEMVGRSRLVCDIDERWNGPPPRCDDHQLNPVFSCAGVTAAVSTGWEQYVTLRTLPTGISFWNAPGGGEGCARFDGSKGWLWADTDCQARLNYICQHQPKACGRPEQPPNSTMTADSFEVGASVEYSCDDGHLLVGPTVRTCLDTGFYDEFPPVCKRIECGFPAEIPHGSYDLMNASVSYLSHVQYSCKAGYEMVGRSRLVCDIDERWNGPPPRCDVVQCEEPPPALNGRVTLSHNASVFGSVAEYSCAKGFKLVGPKRIACLASGLWDKPAPICQPEERPTTTTQATTTSPAATTTVPTPTSPRLVLPTRPRTSPRPLSSPTPFATVTAEPPRRLRPKTTTERVTTRTYERPPERKVTVPDNQDSPTSHIPHIIVASHPRENQILGNGNNIRAEQTPRVNVPQPVDGERRDPVGARLNIGAVVALGAFGALVFLIAIITTIVILVRSRKHNDGKRYRHHVSPDCNTVGSLDSSSSESRSGLNRYYRQAWEELHEAAGAKHAHRRHDREAPKDGSELVVSDVYPAPHARDKRRHHHHHHHREPRHQDWHSPHRPHHNHKPRY
uniref:Sushi, von Willebrand factor type A, EGF and pentraxin domain-containing protein 1 n=1 Tax=Heliothis virescens TaxID=7102 RepID=A0A2A4J811_HELVI